MLAYYPALRHILNLWYKFRVTKKKCDLKYLSKKTDSEGFKVGISRCNLSCNFCEDKHSRTVC